jgi:hypothetical protein
MQRRLWRGPSFRSGDDETTIAAPEVIDGVGRLDVGKTEHAFDHVVRGGEVWSKDVAGGTNILEKGRADLTIDVADGPLAGRALDGGASRHRDQSEGLFVRAAEIDSRDLCESVSCRAFVPGCVWGDFQE